jgi:hypothetical protein
VSGFFEYVTRIPEIVAEAERKVAAANEKTAFDIVSGCKARSRVDTGEMREGWDAAQVGATDWYAYNPVEHTIWNEIGTTDMTAQPMLEPSVEENREPHAAAVAEAYRV